MAKILIVEDNHLNFELANELLIRAGHQVMRAETMPECISATKLHSPNLILMDLHLPDVKGTEITKVLKSNSETKHIPVVAFTAMVMNFDREEAFQAGCAGFISKPINVNTFVKTVEEFLEEGTEEKTTKKEDNCEVTNILQERPEATSNRHQRHNILVVDDSILNAEILKETLEQIGQKVEIAYNGRDVFKKLEEEKFDLVLLDIMMPDISGFSILEEIRANPKTANLPVIFVSAIDQTSTIVKGFDLGSCEYIIKPYKIEELKARVLSILKINDLQNRLLSEKKVLDLIFQFSEDGIILLDSNFRVVSCNHMFLEWIKKSKEEVLRKNFCELINCKKEDCLLSFAEGSYCFELEFETYKGKMSFEAKCSRITPSQDDFDDGYVMVLRDVTARKEVEAQKETFVATLTHDLKTPVRAQIRALEMMLAGKFGGLQSEQVEILNETLNSNKYMFGMLDNLLSTYRYENGNVAINKQNTDINNLIKSCYAELRYLAEDKNQQTTFNFVEKSLNIPVDPVEMKRVILNLISNALNYTDERGEISISTEKKGDNCIISFRDNGRGIPKDELPSLFNKYTSYSKRFRQVGTGLGLYLSKKIVEKHGGSISVESEEGKGSCFTVSLPL